MSASLKLPASTVIAIDGTFASGKGTLGKNLSRIYGLPYLDTGKLYRAVAQAVLSQDADLDTPDAAIAAARSLQAEWLQDPILKSGPVGAAASKIAVYPDVRAALLKYQHDFAAKGGILDGRDIGTVIWPEAKIKLYVDANVEERAGRRHKELVGYGEDIMFGSVLEQLKERDARDKNRAHAPLKPADDAHLLDTSGLSIEDVITRATNLIHAILDA